MQLFRRGKDVDPQDFWRETGEKRGGEVSFRSFATFTGASAGAPLGLPGLLYRVGDVFWFEDFERDNWLARILTSRSKFEKTEMSFRASDVEFTRVVSRGNAARCIVGKADPKSLRPMPGFARLFSGAVMQIGLSNGTSLFFEVMLQSDLVAQLAKR
jgi:hypothetical protein